ncbi:hypothetical protein QWY90_04735 [Flavobacterium paronense]|uniref:Glycosyltransferase RgtA/B/C/D-like domain-containing protein n=1 Tax=Flavobacterium paronense TaxID=1392775 RepID=A0ABV5GFV5_9FLAO|nr:hypothetical protein [Flavobacterium paronense]MDN3676613.1 hypothetical protein [Flavobacterium paronense]
MKSFFGKYKYHILILVIGIIWISVFDFLTQMSSQGVMHSDSYNYQESAKNLYVFFTGHIYRPILMAAITGIPYLFGGSDESIFAFSFYVNLSCWFASFLLLFEILKEFSKPKTAFVFTLFAIFIVGNTVHVFHLLTETIFQFFIILAFYLMLKYYKTKEFWYLSLSLSLLLSSMLIKPGSKFLAIVVTLYFIKEILRNYKSKSIIFLYGSLLMIGIQCVGMKYQFGNFTITYIDSVTYYAYVGSKAMCIKYGKEYSQKDNPRADYLFSYDAINQKKIAGEDFKNQLQFNTLNLTKAYFLDIIENTKSGNSCIEECKNWKKRSHFEFWRKLLFDVSKWQNRIFTLLAFILALYYFLKTYKKPSALIFASFFILYIIILSGISCGQGDRFHLVTFSFMLVLLAKYLSDTKYFKPFFELPQR